ncbi:MAG: hypothetical protein U0997_11430 [Sulfurimicrobium sp.]|nr:hypothetical protein [Sulfurimicrobium sp.]
MTGCCENKSCTLHAMRASQGRVLKIVLAVNYRQSRWPDVIVGAIIAALFLKSAMGVLQQSLASLRTQTK